MINKKYIKKRLTEELMKLEDKKVVAGVLIKCTSTDRVFLLLRNDPKPLLALMSGTIEKGENVLDGLKREIYEELFLKPDDIVFKYVSHELITQKNRDFYYFEGFVDKEFKPILDEENLKFDWFEKDKLPSPLYSGLIQKIKNI